MSDSLTSPGAACAVAKSLGGVSTAGGGAGATAGAGGDAGLSLLIAGSVFCVGTGAGVSVRGCDGEPARGGARLIRIIALAMAHNPAKVMNIIRCLARALIRKLFSPPRTEFKRAARGHASVIRIEQAARHLGARVSCPHVFAGARLAGESTARPGTHLMALLGNWAH